MTNQIALGLAVVIIGFFVLDHFVFQLDAGTFVMRKLLGAIRFLAIWR